MKELHSAEEAIAQAKEAGYIEAIWNDQFVDNYLHFFTDPLFWQTLGRAREWKERLYICDGCGLSLREDEITAWQKCKKCDSDVQFWDSWEFWGVQWYKEIKMRKNNEKLFWQSMP